MSLFLKESQPKTPPPRVINWDYFIILLVVFSFVFILQEVSSAAAYFLSTPAPIALLGDRLFNALTRGQLLPLTATNLNALWGHIQRAVLNGRLPGAQIDNFAASFDRFVAALPQNLRKWTVSFGASCLSFPDRFNQFLEALEQAAANSVTQVSAWKNLISARLGSASIKAFGDRFRALANLAAAPKTALPLLFWNSLPSNTLVILAAVPLQLTLKLEVELILGVLLRY